MDNKANETQKNPPKIKDIVRRYDNNGFLYWGVVNTVSPRNVVVLWQTGEYEQIAVKEFRDTRWLN